MRIIPIIIFQMKKMKKRKIYFASFLPPALSGSNYFAKFRDPALSGSNYFA
jgi:hypothetical protein